MRGRRGHSSSSSSVTRQQSRMALRKELIPDISVDNQQQDQSTEEDELPSLLRSTSSAREKRRKERDSQVKQKEMTEEEMMDLALQLSKQEASNTALRQQREDEDVMKAIQESMVTQKQPSLKSPNKSLLGAASTSLGSRRKLSYTNGEKLPQEGDMNSGDETITSTKKQKRSTDSSLLEMPDLSQTQNLSCQNSLCSPESFSLNLDSPQSSDSTHIDDSQLQMSPVFPLTGCKAEVHIKRLNRDLVETCKTSGFVMFSEDSIPSTQNSAQPKSPVFPQSNRVSSPKSPVFLEDEEGHGGELEQSPKFVKSQIYGRTAEHEMSPNASEPPACENEEFGFSSQESFIPTLRSCPPQSPVFPKTPSDMLAINSDTDQEPAERGDECSVSPVFGSTEEQKTDLQEKPGEVRGSEHDQNIPDCRKDRKSNGVQTADFNRPLSESEVNGKSDGCNSAEKEVTSDMTLVWSEEDDDDETPVVSPSPVFAEQEKVVPRVSQPGSSVNDVSEAEQKCSQQPCCTSGQELSLVSRQGVTRESPPPPGKSSGDQMIHYYWGVPFCPRGLDPDTYTQVIVAQMEVYEKSLKQAQRGLLRKAEWGKAIQPEPEKSLSPEAPAESPQSGRPRRRGLRLRSSKRSKAPEFDEEEEKRDDDGEEEQQGKEEDEEQKDGDEEQMDTDDCEVCPETQLSDNDGTTELSLVTDTETQISSQHPQKSPELSEIKMLIRDDTPTRSMPQELEQRMKTQTDSSMEKNSPECREDAEQKTAGELEKVTENKKNQDVVKLEDKGLQRSESPELEADVVPHSPETSIDCPICQGSFPASKIEMHAAYCDGEVTVVNQRVPESDHVQDSTKPRRKRMKRTEASSEEFTTLSDVCRRQEKCYICQKNVPLKDYSRHTELCVQRGTFRRAAKGNLLSALEQTESKNSGAGPSGSKPQPEAVIDLRDDDDDEDEGEQGVSGYRVSNSPIRSFTPISEATGCLIDFRKQQRTKKPTQRRR